MNTEIDYLYRDASNYKNRNRQVLVGTLTKEQIEEIFAACDGGEYFIPRQVGLPEERIEEVNEDDHSWFEIRRIFPVNTRMTLDMTAVELYQNFLKAFGKWDETLWQGGEG